MLSTIEYHLVNKKVTLITKYPISKINTPPTTSSPTSDPVSNSKKPAFKQFWTATSKKISQKLWLPTKRYLANSDIHYLNGFSNNMTTSSFVITHKNPRIPMNYQKIACLSSPSIPPDTPVNTNITNNYCRKIRFYPSQNHRLLLNKCFGATRYLINQALEHIKSGNIQKPTNAIDIRNYLKYQDKYLTPENSWLKEIPYDTRDEAIRQLASNFKTNFTMLKKKQISRFDMKFKSKHTNRQVCYINKKALNLSKSTLFVRRVKDILKFGEDVSSFKDHGTLTVVKENGKYYMCYPLSRVNVVEKKPHRVVALDPGVKTFQSFYSPSGEVGKIGDNMAKDLKRYYILVDKLKGVLTKLKNQRKKGSNIKKRCALLRTKVKNKVLDLHRKACSFLTHRYEKILLPSFETSQMVKKEDRKIGKPVVRGMLALSHYKFKKRLQEMGEANGCEVIICGEAYTSITCGQCGFLDYNLGDSRVYECPECDMVMDRDYNGARNIYLKNIDL